MDQAAKHQPEHDHISDVTKLLGRLLSVRATTVSMVKDLSDADATVQSMEDASPAKWHLAHTSWFFETLVLQSALVDYQVFDPAYNYLFNSYYEKVGARHPRPRRGMITRPSLDDILSYRKHVDNALERLKTEEVASEIVEMIELGLNHEEQHQELLLTDILHLFAQSPIEPAYSPIKPELEDGDELKDLTWSRFESGIREIGAGDDGFSYDNEKPRHRVLTNSFEIADRPVTCGDWIEFIEDGGYRDPLLWLSDGWALVQDENWQAPLYWHQEDDSSWSIMTLYGRVPVQKNAPVSHISYFEADAYARWAGARLPREEEWEIASVQTDISGNFVESNYLMPQALKSGIALQAMLGSVWEWTQTPYVAYPGFQPLQGGASEYNGKFMCGQFVLRGGSCATSIDHIRPTYRNFFYPHQRWQFAGLRLARDV